METWKFYFQYLSFNSRENLRWVFRKIDIFQVVNFTKSSVALKRLGITPETIYSLKRAHLMLSNAYFRLRWNCLSFEKSGFFWARPSIFVRFSWKHVLAISWVQKVHELFFGQKVPKIDMFWFSYKLQYFSFLLPYRSSKSAYRSRRC